MKKTIKTLVILLLIGMVVFGNKTTYAQGCFKKIAAGYTYTVAIKTDGSLWAWGNNQYGQLGDGTNTNKNSPIQVGSATNWASIAVGFGLTFATKTDGSLWAWG